MSFLLGGQFCSKTTFEEQWRYKLPFHTRHLMQKNDPEQTQGKKTKKKQRNLRQQQPQLSRLLSISHYQLCKKYRSILLALKIKKN